MPRHPIAASETEGAVDIERTWRRAHGAAAAVLAVAALAGCSSLSAEDFKTMLGGVGQVAQAAGEYETARRNNRSNAAQGVNAAGAQAAPAYAAPAAGYSALSCARVTPRGGGLCMENSCAGVVMVHARSGAGAFGPVALAPGQCAPIVPGTVAAVACRAGDRFDWQRATCVGS